MAISTRSGVASMARMKEISSGGRIFNTLDTLVTRLLKHGDQGSEAILRYERCIGVGNLVTHHGAVADTLHELRVLKHALRVARMRSWLQLFDVNIGVVPLGELIKIN